MLFMLFALSGTPCLLLAELSNFGDRLNSFRRLNRHACASRKCQLSKMTITLLCLMMLEGNTASFFGVRKTGAWPVTRLVTEIDRSSKVTNPTGDNARAVPVGARVSCGDCRTASHGPVRFRSSAHRRRADTVKNV